MTAVVSVRPKTATGCESMLNVRALLSVCAVAATVGGAEVTDPAPSWRPPTQNELAPRAAAAASAALPRAVSALTTPASRNTSVRPWLVSMLVKTVSPATRASVAVCCCSGALSVTSEYTVYRLSNAPARHSVVTVTPARKLTGRSTVLKAL